MLSISSDLPVMVYGLTDEKVKIRYVSGYCLAFDYLFFVDNLEYIFTTPFMDALENKESDYLGLFPEF